MEEAENEVKLSLDPLCWQLKRVAELLLLLLGCNLPVEETALEDEIKAHIWKLKTNLHY